MQTYKDITFCPSWLLCKDGVGCPRALTQKITDGAHSVGLPICQYASMPDCFRAWFTPEDATDATE